MSTFKAISLIVLVALAVSYVIYPKPEMAPVEPKQLPWHVEIDGQNNTSIFGLKFTYDTLQKVLDTFGEPEQIALYANPEHPTIEAYFGKVTVAGLSAKLVISMDVSKQDAEAFLQNSTKRMKTQAAIAKLEIHPKDRYKTLSIPISSLTYIPQYSGLEKDYLLDRFGKPDYELKLNDTATQFFYKNKGLSVISDSDGKELFQYTHPSLLIIPDKAVTYEH